jgi:S1-C subfamily serine protease
VVARVTPETPFSQQGRLQPGDVIYALNGQVVRSAEDLKAFAAQLKPGAAAVLLIEREGALMYLAFRVDRQ